MRRRAAQSKAGDDIHSFGAKCERRRSRAMWRLHYEKTRNWLARKIWFVTVLTFKTEHVVGSAISLKMNLIFFNKKFLLLSDFSLTATNTNRQPKEPKEQLCANIDDSGGGHCLLGADDKERQEESSTLMANQTRHDVGKECMFHGPLSGKQCWPNTTKNLKRFSFVSIF